MKCNSAYLFEIIQFTFYVRIRISTNFKEKREEMHCKTYWVIYLKRNFKYLLLPVAAASLVACGGGGSSQDSPVSTCIETGEYACKSGETEPLYSLQWVLNYAKSYFSINAEADAFGGGIDLNVEPVHRLGYKGQGVKVLVVDEGVDIGNEDLKPNIDRSMSWNFRTMTDDPTPLQIASAGAHGTNVAGIIGAAQNGKGVMGISPLVKIGGALWLGTDNMNENHVEALGGASWSQKADIINASYGGDLGSATYSIESNMDLAALRAMRGLRNGKGIVYVKSAGNSFDSDNFGYDIRCGDLYGFYDCINPSNDVSTLEPTAIVTAALNAKGQASSYSSAGSVVWVTGMGGEGGNLGKYGEISSGTISRGSRSKTLTHDGPNVYSTDVRGCDAGYSFKDAFTTFLKGKSELRPGIKDNENCDYSSMNGTSAAAPTISGVVALMLSANPDLTWRDVRDILRLSARKVDMGYEKRTRNDVTASLKLPYNSLFDLTRNSFTAKTGSKEYVFDNSTQVPVEFGWQMNAAGDYFSNWYGFGVPDAYKAVQIALDYKKDPAKSKASLQAVPTFSQLKIVSGFNYQSVMKIAEFQSKSSTVDAFQVRLTGENICLGNFGVVVESPAGTKSYLKMPLDHFATDDFNTFKNFGLSSYAFYGENAQGTWKIYSVASNPSFFPDKNDGNPQFCSAAPATGTFASNAKLWVEARVIPQ